MKKLYSNYKNKIICIGLIAIFFILAVINLGENTFPETVWKEKTETEGVLKIKFAEEKEISKIVLLNGVGDSTISILEGENPLTEITQDYGNVFFWMKADIRVTANELNLKYTKKPEIREIGFLDIENNFIKIEEIFDNNTKEEIEELYDEQEYLVKDPSHFSGAYFDEVYYARSGEEFL